MAQSLILTHKGLVTNSNQLSQAPQGSLSVAKNIVIDKDGVAEPCRGFTRVVNPPVVDTVRFDRLANYQGKIIAHRSDDNSLSWYDSTSGYTSYAGTYNHPDNDYARIQFSATKGNLYFTTSAGVRMLDSYAGPVYSTGMPKALDGQGVTTGSSGMMANNTQVAYRIVWGTRDANNNLYLGAPSQRIIVANTSGGTRDVSLTFTIPAGVTTDDFYQVYRSKESASSTDEPNDELQLVYEKAPTSGEITAKSVTFTDSTPISLMGASLYTNASQEGIAEANDEPPFAKDICVFKDYTFYLNLKTKHKLSIKLLAVGGSALVNDDTITVAGVTYTGKAVENVASAQFQVVTSGSASQNIADTAQSLVKVINQHSGNTLVYAYYMSGYQDLPGQILISKRNLDDTSFAVTTSRALAFDLGSGTSSNDEYVNGIAWSKKQAPEHVPASHLEFVGSKNYEGRRILALRDSLFILKEDGVYRLTGNGGSWNIDPIDTSTRIIAPDSAVVMNNQIFALCDQGIVTISDVGVQVISRPIEDEVVALISTDYTKLKTLTFGLSYETDRKYYLWTFDSSSDTYPTKAFVYNTFTQAWTTRYKNARHAIVTKEDDKIFLCNPSDKHIFMERKSLTFRDYVDEEVDGFTIVSSSGTSVVLNTTVGLEVGYLLYASSTVYAMITAIDTVNNAVTVNDVKTWPVGAITVCKSIDVEIEYAVQHFQNPGVMKHFQECGLLFRESNFVNGAMSFYTDISGGYSNTSVRGNFGGNIWGAFNWGNIPWGGVERPKIVRVFVPREKSRGTLVSIKFRVNNAYARWALNGVSIQYDWVSERATRA